jgi:hypothetical protein
MKLDLFLLHDDKLDYTPKKCLVVSGTNLKEEIDRYIKNLINAGWTKKSLSEYFSKRLSFSKITCEKLVYLRKDFYHLVFLRELLKLCNSYDKRFDFQDKIDYIKACQPPEKIYSAVKLVSPELCKFAGAHAADGTIKDNYFALSEGYLSNMKTLQTWIFVLFGIKYKINKISNQEWKINFHSKVITRYLTHLLYFPNGYKTNIVSIPKPIANTNLKSKQEFTKGFMTFESGIGIKNEIELCVLSKQIIDELAEVFSNTHVKFVKKKPKSGNYYRIWSGKINQKEAKQWLQFYEEDTFKYNHLRDYANGYTNTANTFTQAIQILNFAFPKKPNNKTSLIELILAMRKIEICTRHDLKNAAKLKSFGGPWNGSLKPYLLILEQTKIIITKIGKSNGKSCQIYTYNPNIKTWLLPSAKIE